MYFQQIDLKYVGLWGSELWSKFNKNLKGIWPLWNGHWQICIVGKIKYHARMGPSDCSCWSLDLHHFYYGFFNHHDWDLAVSYLIIGEMLMKAKSWLLQWQRMEYTSNFWLYCKFYMICIILKYKIFEIDGLMNTYLCKSRK